jgi:hypothetical protein
MTGIHLFVPMLHVRDAVGEHTRALHDLLVADGVECRIYTETPDPDTVDETRPYLDYEEDAVPGDVLVYQMATRSGMAGWLAGRPEPVVVNYHSITPPEYFAPWNNWIARHQVGATRELRGLAPTAALGIGVSEFDARELPWAPARAAPAWPMSGSRPSSPMRQPWPHGKAARRTAPVGCRWVASPPTRPTRTPSPPCSWPGPPRRPAPG